jgi:glycopeptide antibiotics resistance protein
MNFFKKAWYLYYEGFKNMAKTGEKTLAYHYHKIIYNVCYAQVILFPRRTAAKLF